MRKRILTGTLAVLFLAVVPAWAGTLSGADAKKLESSGIPSYPGAVFVNGTLGGGMGVRFATSDPVEKVRAFYRQRLSSWALDDQYGSWILYDGKPGGGPAEYMDKKQVMVTKNGNLPGWFGLAGEMTTEILVVVP